MNAMGQGFTMALRRGNTWLLQYQGDNGETRRSEATLSDENISRLAESLRGGGLNQEEVMIGSAVVQMANARTRGQGEDFEISDAEVDEFLANVRV